MATAGGAALTGGAYLAAGIGIAAVGAGLANLAGQGIGIAHQGWGKVDWNQVGTAAGIGAALGTSFAAGNTAEGFMKLADTKHGLYGDRSLLADGTNLNNTKTNIQTADEDEAMQKLSEQAKMNYYAAYNKEAAEDFEKGLIVGQYYAYQKTVGKQYKKLMNRLSGAADDLVAQLEARQELDTEIEVGYNRQMDDIRTSAGRYYTAQHNTADSLYKGTVYAPKWFKIPNIPNFANDSYISAFDNAVFNVGNDVINLINPVISDAEYISHYGIKNYVQQMPGTFAAMGSAMANSFYNSIEYTFTTPIRRQFADAFSPASVSRMGTFAIETALMGGSGGTPRPALANISYEAAQTERLYYLLGVKDPARALQFKINTQYFGSDGRKVLALGRNNIGDQPVLKQFADSIGAKRVLDLHTKGLF